MKIRLFFSFLIVGLFFTIPVMTQEETNSQLPPGMKRIKIGNSTRLIPEDSQVYRDEKGIVSVEDRSAYLARKFKEVEKRVSVLEKETEKLKEEVNRLKEENKESTDKINDLNKEVKDLQNNKENK